jgi:hypothetical protein
VSSRTQLAHRVINQDLGLFHPTPASQGPLVDGRR